MPLSFKSSLGSSNSMLYLSVHLLFGTSNDGTISVDPNLRARLVAATTIGGGTATFSMPRALGEQNVLGLRYLMPA